MAILNWIAQLDDAEFIALVGTFFTVAGIVLGFVTVYWQFRGLRNQLTLQHFADYTKRYQEIIQRFPEDINQQNFDLGKRQDHDQIMRAMRMYFDLCFEEWYLRKRRFIDRRIWEIWNDGMATAFSKPAFRDAWKKVKTDTVYGEEFLKFVEERHSARAVSDGKAVDQQSDGDSN